MEKVGTGSETRFGMNQKIHHNVRQLTVLQRPTTDNADDASRQCSLAKRPCILLVTRSRRMDEPVMDYAVNVADRMDCKILAAYVNTLPLFGNGDVYHKQFAAAIEQNAAEFKAKAVGRDVDFEYVQESGKISKIISRLCRLIKRIEFVLIDQGIKIEEAAFGSPVPVFNIVCTDSRTGERIDNHQANPNGQEEKRIALIDKKRYWIKTLLFGIITGVLYAAVFTNVKTIMQFFTKGGVYALLPVATVCVFSYVHGSFLSNFCTALGVEDSKGTVIQQVDEAKSIDKHSDTRPRVQAGA